VIELKWPINSAVHVIRATSICINGKSVHSVTVDNNNHIMRCNVGINWDPVSMYYSHSHLAWFPFPFPRSIQLISHSHGNSHSHAHL